jgi:hypothetical protein
MNHEETEIVFSFIQERAAVKFDLALAQKLLGKKAISSSTEE